MNYDNTSISVIVTFCIISFLVGYSVHGYCNNTNDIDTDILEDNTEHQE